MESKKINQLATNVNPQTSDLTTIGDPITGQLKKITWLQVANLIGAQASVTLQQVTDNGNTTTDPITTAGLTLTNLGTGVPQLTNGNFAGTYGYGLANGVATLDSGGKIPASQLPSSVMEYKGTWNASTNTPTLADGTGDNGDVYLVNVAGSQNLGSGTISFAVGDWVVYNGTIWQKSLNSNAVASVFGRTGTIVAQEGDYNIDQLGDVAITSAATNDYLRYNGSSWVNTQFPTFVSSDKLVLQVRNNSGATINKGTVVYINGATAGYPTIAKAQADADNTSAQTLGLVQDNISNNSNGVVVIVGQITGIDTSAYPAGTQLYLSGTTAGAFTSTKTLAPTHLVYVGIVTTQNAVNGVIEVKIQNGYELDEIHDVAISSVANNQGLFYESSTSLWKNKSIATVLGYTPEQPLTFSAPLSRSTNTVSIPAATGSVNGYLTSTDWTTFNNKLTSPMTTLGDIIFGGTSGNANRLAGNTTTTKQYLSQTGTGTESASPTWATITGSDITGAALTKSDDTNVTLTLGGTPSTALLRAASLTLGWTGTLAVSRGGTGASSFGSNEIIYGNSASALQSSSQFTFSPTGVFFINNTISAGGIAMNLVSTVNAAANNDIIYGVRISPTFNNGAFTGVTQRALGVFGDAYINGTITGAAWGGSTITIAKGGTGLTALGTAGQLLRVNSGATALEYWTPTYISAAITSLNGLTAATQTFATGTSGTDFAISSTTSTHTFNLPTASATNRGALSSTDWSTFNGKQAALNGTGLVRMSGTTVSYDNTVYAIGFAANITTNTQLNDNTRRNGMYRVDEGVTASPDSTQYFALNVYGNSDNVVAQLATNMISGESFFRGYNTTWSSWRRVLDTSNYSSYALPLSGGTLTGALNGTSATFSGDIRSNGTYRDYQGEALIGTNTSAVTFIGSTGAATPRSLQFNAGNSSRLTISTTGSATFSSAAAGYGLSVTNVEDSSQGLLVRSSDNDTTLYLARFQSSVGATSTTWVDRFSIAKNGSTVIGDNIPAVNVRLWVKGEDQTASNYAMDVTDSLGQSIAWFRNDKAIRFYGGLTGTSATFSSSVTAGGKYYASASVADNIIEVINTDTTNGYGLYIRAGGTAANRYVARFKNGADSDVMWLDKGGNIGIATTNPDRILTIAPSSGDAYINLKRPVAASTQSTIEFNTAGTNDWLIRTDDASSNLKFYSYGTSGYPLILAKSTGYATFSSDIQCNGTYRDYQGEALLSTNTSAVTSIGSTGAGTQRSLQFNAGNASRFTISTNGTATFTSSVLTNSPSEGATGEGLIVGRSFKIDASGSGQTAKMYIVSNTLSDTYGSGLQIQFANFANTRGFGFNLTTGGAYETYMLHSGSWQRRLMLTSGGNLLINKNTDNGATLQVNGSINGATFISDGAARTVNANNEFIPGFYRWNDDSTNLPEAGFFAVIIYGNGNNVNAQLATHFTNANTYVRSYNSSWTSWRRII